MTDKILFVDDDVNLLAAVRRNLEGQFHLETASSGAEALDLLARQGPYAVVVADMQMPGMNGVELLNSCRERFPDTVRTMLTNAADQETAVQAINGGYVFQFLNKPCPSEVLALALENSLRQYRLAQTRQQMMTSEIQHAAKMVSVGQMAAGITHDFNNILSIISNLTELALMNISDSASVSALLEEMNQAVVNGTSLTRQLLAHCSKQEEICLAEIDPAEFLPRTAKLLRPTLGRQITLNCDCAPDVPPLAADPGLLSQIVINLAINARDAMPDGGQLRFAAASVMVDAASAAARPGAREGQFICLTVADSGCGMDEATRRRIFEPFFTTKVPGKGTGLGMTIVLEAVRKQGGWIETASEPGKGTTFQVFLPAYNNHGSSPEAPLPAAL